MAVSPKFVNGKILVSMCVICKFRVSYHQKSRRNFGTLESQTTYKNYSMYNESRKWK